MDMLVFGYGKMASAMVEGWLRAGVDPARITAYNPRPKPVPDGVTMLTELPERRFDAVVLGFKPQMLHTLKGEVAPLLDSKTIVISILAGIDLAMLQEAFPSAGGWVRWMPNLAVALGKSPNLLAASGIEEGRRAELTGMAELLGSAEWLEDEAAFDLATALAGSGPAFVYRFIDGLSAAAHELGLDRELAARLALQMVEGAAALAPASEISPGELADRVASPGGMTREGMNVLDDGKALETLLKSALANTAARGAELARNARDQG